MINSTLNTGLQGVYDGMRGMDQAARKIARVGVDAPQGLERSEGFDGLTEPLVQLNLYERNVQAAAKVVKSADETLGTLLDIRA